MATTYLIDGYNVIHHSTSLRPLALESFESARDALIEKVARLCAASGARAKIVFDGRGRRSDPGPPFRSAPGLEIIYSPKHQSADTLIERMVYDNGKREDLIVVTSDRGIRHLCLGLGAMSMESNSFLDTVREAHGTVTESLDRMEGYRGAMARIEDGLGEDALKKLEELKKKLES